MGKGFSFNCLVLAAGKGTRLLPLTKKIPKPLFPILNRPAIERVVEYLALYNPNEISVNLHHLSEEIRRWVKSAALEKDIKLLYEETLLDTGGALKNAFENLGYELPILVYNSDVVSNVDVNALFSEYQKKRAKVLLCLHNYPRFNKIEVKGDRVFSFKNKGKGGLAYTGIGIFSPQVFKDVPLSPISLVTVLEDYMKKGGRVFFVRGEENFRGGSGWFWHDIGTFHGYLSANFDLLERELKSDALVEGCKIEGRMEFRGRAVIGEGVKIGGSLILENSIIWPNTMVLESKNFKNSIITPFGIVEAKISG